MKTVEKEDQARKSSRRSSARTKQSRVLSESALMRAAEPPVIFGGEVDAVRKDATAEVANPESVLAPVETEKAEREVTTPETATPETATLDATVESEPVAITGIDSSGETRRPGLIESPLAKRMREEAAQKRSPRGSRRRAERKARVDYGHEFTTLSGRISALRRELKSLRQQKAAIKAKVEKAQAESETGDVAVSASDTATTGTITTDTTSTDESGVGEKEVSPTPKPTSHLDDEVPTDETLIEAEAEIEAEAPGHS